MVVANWRKIQTHVQTYTARLIPFVEFNANLRLFHVAGKTGCP